MISFTGFGILILTIFLHMYILPKRKRLKNQNKKELRQNPLKKSRLTNCLKRWNLLLFPLMTSHTLLFSKFITASSLMSPPKKVSLTLPLFPLPETAPLWSLLPGNASIMSATVKKMESPTAAVNSFFHSLTVILDGILPETVFTTVMICICSLPPTLKVTFLYFLCSILLPNMILMGSLNASSDLKVFCPITMLVNGSWILPMMQCLITCIAAGMGYSHLLI